MLQTPYEYNKFSLCTKNIMYKGLMYSMISLTDCSAGEIHASHDFLGKARRSVGWSPTPAPAQGVVRRDVTGI